MCAGLLGMGGSISGDAGASGCRVMGYYWSWCVVLAAPAPVYTRSQCPPPGLRERQNDTERKTPPLNEGKTARRDQVGW